jgi:phenylacetate-coenzyme A ligase PaaK-like adenylate-forming protein
MNTNSIRFEVKNKVDNILNKAPSKDGLGLRSTLVKLMMMCGEELTEAEREYIQDAVRITNNYMSEWDLSL